MAGERILVIKLGALGDFVQALGPMAAIRHHHPKAHIALMTSRPYADFARASALFDEVYCDRRAKIWQLRALLAVRRWLLAGRFSMVYDLQTAARTTLYYHLMGPGKRPLWSGIAPGCSHPHANPARDTMHTVDRQREQLAMAGIDNVPISDLSWASMAAKGMARSAREVFTLPARFALVIPGGAAHRPDKRWGADRFAQLARRLMARSITPVVLGTENESAIIEAIVDGVPGVVSLAGKTDFIDIASLAREALCAVGNDTGPMHLIALAGAPSVVVYSHASDPALCAQRGAKVRIVRRARLDRLDVDTVLSALDEIVESPPQPP